MIYTIKQFIKSGVHLGHYKWECDYRLSYFLLGIRNSVHIINLYYTLFILKQALYISYNMCVLNQKILIVNNAGYELNLNFENINQKYLWFINNRWIGGLLTNQKGIFFNNEKLFLNFYGLGYSSLLPSYVFASNVKETSSCIFESIILNIPCSALIDSNMGYYGIFYGIPSNDDNFVTIYLFTRLFIKMYFKSIYNNISIFKVNEDIISNNILDEDNRIQLDFVFNKMSQAKYSKKFKRFVISNLKEEEDTFLNSEWIKRKAFQDNIILEWKIKKNNFKKKKIKKKKS